MRLEPGSNTADAGGRRGRTQDGTGELDDLIQRIFTAGVLLGSALAGGRGTVTGVDEAIRRLDDAVRTIPPPAPASRERAPICEIPARVTG